MATPKNIAIGPNAALFGELFSMIENIEGGGGFEVPPDGSEFIVGTYHGLPLYCKEYIVLNKSNNGINVLEAGFSTSKNLLYGFGNITNLVNNKKIILGCASVIGSTYTHSSSLAIDSGDLILYVNILWSNNINSNIFVFYVKNG